jgi:hypothetical protein
VIEAEKDDVVRNDAIVEFFELAGTQVIAER